MVFPVVLLASRVGEAPALRIWALGETTEMIRHFNH